jgi:hypothetical protein
MPITRNRRAKPEQGDVHHTGTAPPPLCSAHRDQAITFERPDMHIISSPAPRQARRLIALLGTAASALPFLAILLMIAGFSLIVRPLVVTGLPAFLGQTALALPAPAGPPMLAAAYQRP